MSPPGRETKAVLEAFADLIYTASARLDDLTTDELATLLEAQQWVSSTNCGWAEFEAARWPWLRREAERIRRERAAG